MEYRYLANDRFVTAYHNDFMLFIFVHLKFPIAFVVRPGPDTAQPLCVFHGAFAVPLASFKAPSVGRSVAIASLPLTVRLAVVEIAEECVLWAAVDAIGVMSARQGYEGRNRERLYFLQ